MDKKNFNILIVGVGGQGVLLASEILSEVAMRVGLDVKKSEVHGMSQRGGVVSSHVKIAEKVYSPTIHQGQVDILLSFERAEALRAVNWLRKDSIAVISQTTLVPAIVTSSRDLSYPDDPIGQVKQHVDSVIAVPADEIAAELGNPRLVNTILLGVVSNYMPFPVEAWTETMKLKVKAKFVEVNLKAFQRGRELQSDLVKA
jgi:indolepyruvate ferredoxin oxidoreductase beta subunit